MSIIYVLIPLGLILLGLAIWAFFWAAGSGQFDDLETPAWRILLDDDRRPPDTNREPTDGDPIPEKDDER
jgi:cbb3-type cytochrome oxidase maturation protein